MINSFTVAKFGGSSLANAVQIRKVEEIIDSDYKRKYVVVSAPGVDENNKDKVTDMLYNLYYNSSFTKKFRPEVFTNEMPKYKSIDLSDNDLFNNILKRYESIAQGLEVDNSIIKDFNEELEYTLYDNNSTVDDIVSRGENFSARIIARYFNAKFIDSSKLIYIDKSGNPDNDITMEWIQKTACSKDNIQYKGRIIIPGFYGNSSVDINVPKIKTFSRGGSDLTGSLIAAGVNAKLYENWTDQNGILCVDPRLFDNKKNKNIPVIDTMTFKECRELTYSGFSVLNDETVGPVRSRNIPINILNTNNPSHPGTTIQSNNDSKRAVVGIAGRNGFCTIDIEKHMLNKEDRLEQRLKEIFTSHNLSYDQFIHPKIDNASIVLEYKKLQPHENQIIEEIRNKIQTSNVKVTPDLALITLVAEGIMYDLDVKAQITSCLNDRKINIETWDMGASESNIEIGVSSKNYKKSMMALYNEFFRQNIITRTIKYLKESVKDIE